MENEVKCDERENLHKSHNNYNSGKYHIESIKSLLENMQMDPNNNISVSNSMPNLHTVNLDTYKPNRIELFKKLKKNFYLFLVIILLLYVYYMYMSVS